MPIARVAAVTAALIAGICIFSTSAAPQGPAAKMSGAGSIYGSTGSSAPKTCSAFFALCTSRNGASPKCASARATCMQTGVYKRYDGQIFKDIARR